MVGKSGLNLLVLVGTCRKNAPFLGVLSELFGNLLFSIKTNKRGGSSNKNWPVGTTSDKLFI